MKKRLLLGMFCFLTILSLQAQSQEGTADAAKFEVKVITSVESIVPNGLGRSRLISTNEDRDYMDYTTTQSEDDNTRNKSKRKDIRLKEFDETKLLNFYNMAGIRFQNIAAMTL